MHQTFRTPTGTLCAAMVALSMTVLCAAPMRAGAQSVAVTITLDADTVEILRAWRRQQGLDPPDAHADARVARLLQRVRAGQRPAVAVANQGGVAAAATPMPVRSRGDTK
jgi:hypothetical protein